MKIKEQSESRIVIVRCIGDLFLGRMGLKYFILFLILGLVIYFLLNPVWGILLICILVLIAFLLYLLSEIAGEKIIIDKPTASIIFKKRLFMLIPRHHIIPFSLVQMVYAENRTYGRADTGVSSMSGVSIKTPGESSTFEVSIVTPGWKMARIFQSSKASVASNVAEMVGSLIGTEVWDRVEDL